jgi:hypothetical protein
MQIREVKTGSDSTAVQVIYYKNRKRIVFKHIGSAKTEEEIKALRVIAEQTIQSYSNQLSIFEEDSLDKAIYTDQYECVGIQYNWIYNIITFLQKKIGFTIA